MLVQDPIERARQWLSTEPAEDDPVLRARRFLGEPVPTSPQPLLGRTPVTSSRGPTMRDVEAQRLAGEQAAMDAKGAGSAETDGGQPGILRRAWDAVNRPVLPWISRKAHELEEAIAAPSSTKQALDVVAALATRTRPGELRGFAAGVVGGAGDVVAGLTSPANLAMTAAGAGAPAAAARGLRTASNALRGMEAAGGAAFALEGAHQAATADTLAGRLAGVGAMAGGAAGAVHGVRGPRPGRTPVTPTAKPQPRVPAEVRVTDAAPETPLPRAESPTTADPAAALVEASPEFAVRPETTDMHGGLGVVGQTTDTPITEPFTSARPGRAVQTLAPDTIEAPTRPADAMGERQRLEGIGLDSFDESVRPALREVLQQHHGFAEQRRDVQSWERTQQLSERIAVDVTSSLPKGRVLNAEQTTAFANTLATLTDRVTTLADQARKGTLDDIGRLSLEEARAAQVAVMQSVWGTVTEQGRALNAWKATKRVLETHDAAFIKQALELMPDDGATLGQILTDLGGDPVKQYAWLKEQTRAKRSAADRLSSYYYANILSGVATHERNILSNSAQLLFGLAADAGAGKVGHARASVKGMWNALSKREPQQGPYALALPRAFQEVFFNLRQGFSPTDVQAGKLDFGRILPEFAGGGANPFNYPSRALNAADGFFRALVNQGERYRAAYDIARKGTDGTLEQRMAEALNDLPASKVREIDEMTARAVFQETPGKVTRAFLNLRETVPGMRYVVPFVRIAANLTRQGVEVTPAGFVMNSAKQPGRIGEAARAKAALGSVALLPIAYYAATGRITGSGPTDPGKRQAWLDSGKRPNSILNPATGEWVSYTAWQPVALPMSLVANLVEAYRDAEQAGQPVPTASAGGADAAGETQDQALDAWTSLGLQTVMRTGNSVLQQSFLSGVSGLLDAMNDPERSADRFFMRLAQGFVPLSGAMRTATQVVDPVTRTPKTVREGVEAIIPGRSSKLPPLADRFGEPTPVTGHPLTRGFYQASPSKNDPLQPLLDRAGVEPTRPSGTLRAENGAVKLTRDEESALQQARGRTRRQAYERVRREVGAAWPNLPAEVLNDKLTGAASAAERTLTTRARALKREGRALTLGGLMPGGTPVTPVQR